MTTPAASSNEPYLRTDRVVIWNGDCVEVMRSLPANSIDSIVSDPPYGLEFMGKDWDAPWKATGTTLVDPADVGGFQDGAGGNPYSRSRVRFGIGAGFQQWCETWAIEAYRVLKPGGHAAIFGGTRTYHRLACAIEDAGFEIRDSLVWLYGSGFPKSMDVSKAIDKSAGAERPKGVKTPSTYGYQKSGERWTEDHYTTTSATDEAKQWEGWGTALKPAYEPIVLARKPLIGTVAANVLKHGTGALNIDGTRIDGIKDVPTSPKTVQGTHTLSMPPGAMTDDGFNPNVGRWPANVLLECICIEPQPLPAEIVTINTFDDGAKPFGGGAGHPYTSDQRGVSAGYVHTNTECPCYMLDEQAPLSGGAGPASGPTLTDGSERNAMAGWFAGTGDPPPFYGDHGGASRFFYTSKASRSEREMGMYDVEPKRRSDGRKTDHEVPNLRTSNRRNDHPTVKPVDLMQWLCRLITPPNGVVLDPFLGSGSTAVAAVTERFRFVGIDLDPHYCEIAAARVNHTRLPLPK